MSDYGDAAGSDRDRGSTLRWAAVIGIGVIAIVRGVVLFAPQIAFDIDPAVDPLRFAGAGPATSLILDFLLLLAAAAALLGEHRAGRGVDWRLVGLAALPLPAVVVHAAGDASQLWRGSFWVAAAAAAVAAAHLARGPATRAALVALLLAAIVPPVVRGYVQVYHEHASTVELFEQTMDQVVREKGWQPGSPAALIYERRLRQPQPSAWFLSPNALATLCAAGIVAFAGLAVGAARGRMTSGWWGAAALAAAGCGWCLWLTGSRGGIGAAVLALAFLAIPLVAAGRRLAGWTGGGRGRRVAGGIAVALVLLVPIGVVVRGAVLPEGFAGDRSLLFRWHYAQAATRVVTRHPLVGTGPGRFQEAYMSVRNPRSPEEVTSTHSAWWDWLAMLGVGGAGWIGLTLLLGYRAAAAPDEPAAADAVDTGGPSPVMLASVATLGVAGGLIVEAHVLAPVGTLARLGGALAAGAVVLFVPGILRGGDRRWASWTLAAAAIAVLVHVQIELTLFEPAAAVWAMALLGVAGGARAGSRGGPSVAAAVALLAVAVAGLGFVPAAKRESAQRRAAAVLEPVGEARWNMQYAIGVEDARTFRRAIDLVIDALGKLGVDPREIAALDLVATAASAIPLDQRQVDGFARLVGPIEAARREEAAEILLAASSGRHPDPILVSAAVGQLIVAAQLNPPRRETLLRRAATVADAAVERDGRASLHVAAINPHVALAAVTRDPASRARAIELARALTEIDPHGNETWKRLGDLAWLDRDRELAIQAYGRALDADDQFALDPLAQFSDRDRAAILERLRFLESSGETP